MNLSVFSLTPLRPLRSLVSFLSSHCSISTRCRTFTAVTSKPPSRKSAPKSRGVILEKDLSSMAQEKKMGLSASSPVPSQPTAWCSFRAACRLRATHTVLRSLCAVPTSEAKKSARPKRLQHKDPQSCPTIPDLRSYLTSSYMLPLLVVNRWLYRCDIALNGELPD